MFFRTGVPHRRSLPLGEVERQSGSGEPASAPAPPLLPLQVEQRHKSVRLTAGVDPGQPDNLRKGQPMKTATKQTVTTKAVRELKGLRTSKQTQAANLHHCCRCCRR